MERDRRYAIVKSLISSGYIKTFRDIFNAVPKSVIARDLGINNMRFTKHMFNVHKFTLEDIFNLANLLEVDEDTIVNLVIQQYLLDKKNKKKKSK